MQQVCYKITICVFILYYVTYSTFTHAEELNVPLHYLLGL